LITPRPDPRAAGTGVLMSKKVRVLLVALLAVVPLGVVTSARAEDPPPAPPQVSITVDRATYVAGTTAYITIAVTQSPGDNDPLYIHAVRADGTEFDLPGADPADGTRTEKLFTDINTRITATVGSVSKYVDVRVRPAMGTGPGGKYGWSGRYVVYPHAAKPLFTSQSYPKRPGQMCLRHQVQRLRAGAWRTVKTSGCRLENSKGLVSWRWTGTHPSKVRFRVRATFGGDARNIAGTGTWLYFRLR